MRKYILFTVFLISFWGWAQPFETPTSIELGIKPKPDDNQMDIKPLIQEKAPTLSDFDSNKLPEPSFLKAEGKSVFDKPEFSVPNHGIAEKINKSFQTEGRENLEEFKRNQYFGDFKTISKYIKLVYRDHLAFDGDRVQIIVNDKVVLSNVLLEPSYKSLQIELVIGFNKVEIIALNQGTSGPNTAEFQVYDDQGELISSNQWELATGFKGSIILIKEN
ncbi:MAG TPA: hypothetical protein VLZ11_07165 [Flavobacterium sp.]|nr:hypothetical protein [Flavobacterium sp.]